jgi:hypothetical protein
MMEPIKIESNDLLVAEGQIPPDVPVVMLNLVTYHESVRYSDTDSCTGREAYLTRYAPAFRKATVAAEVSGIEVLYLGAFGASIVPRQTRQWDEVVLVRYPNFSAVRKVVESPLYKAEAEPHRKLALKEWHFIATVPATRIS